MGANVELDIFLQKEDFSLQPLFALFATEGWTTNVQEIRVFDDWNYTNEIILDPDTLDLGTSDLFLKKFVLLHFVVNDQWKCTLITSFIEDRYIDVSFGLDTDNPLRPGEHDIDDSIVPLFNRVTDIINSMNSDRQFKERFIAASMGVEYSIQFHRDILTMLQDENGVQRWILPKEAGKQLLLQNFLKEEKSETMVFTRLTPC